jgi:hypothetical protein
MTGNERADAYLADQRIVAYTAKSTRAFFNSLQMARSGLFYSPHGKPVILMDMSKD